MVSSGLQVGQYAIPEFLWPTQNRTATSFLKSVCHKVSTDHNQCFLVGHFILLIVLYSRLIFAIKFVSF